MPETRSARRTALAAVFLVSALLLSACSDGGDTVPVGGDGDERPTSSVESGADTAEYCRAAEALDADSGLDLSDDPAAAVAGIEQLAAAAPEEIAGDLEVLLGGIRGLVDLDENDPDALAAIFELVADPDFEAAVERVEEFTGEQCGIDLGASSPAGGASGADDREIELEDVDAVKDDNSGSTWADKLSTTVINLGTDVQVSAGEGGLSPDEAKEACNALLSSLSMIDPDVTVAVAAGETVLVETSDGSCVGV